MQASALRVEALPSAKAATTQVLWAKLLGDWRVECN